jgi:hypothetical protein
LSKIKIENRVDIVRDKFSGAILSNDASNVFAYKARKNEINKMRSLENKIVEMESDLKDIKFLLQKIVDEKRIK